MFIAYHQAFAKQFVIKDVHVPYSIRIKEYSSFDMDKPISKDDILPTYNLLYPTKYSYGNGIYEYELMGSPHSPSKIFIHYNSPKSSTLSVHPFLNLPQLSKLFI